VILPDVEYARPATVEEALAELGAHRNARALAGGQTLLNVLKLRVAEPAVLVDVSRLEPLRHIAVDADGALRIGAAVTYDEVASSPLVRERHPVVAAMTGRLVDRQVRARGTVGGNVCLADPTSNWPPLVVALDAELVVRSPRGARTVPAGEFFLAPYVTAVGAGELLTEIVLPPLPPGAGVGYESLQLGTDSWALARACAVVRLTARGDVRHARVVLGCADVPLRQPAVEEALVGGPPTPERIAASAALTGEGFDPPTDVHASADYRRRMAAVMVRRALTAATAGGGEGDG
jgi:carbon-monoxide dehydrogenase medium subunit